jgi:hypothetical protein
MKLLKNSKKNISKQKLNSLRKSAHKAIDNYVKCRNINCNSIITLKNLDKLLIKYKESVSKVCKPTPQCVNKHTLKCVKPLIKCENNYDKTDTLRYKKIVNSRSKCVRSKCKKEKKILDKVLTLKKHS